MLWVVPALAFVGCAASSWFAARSAQPYAVTTSAYLWLLWSSANAAWLSNAMWALPVLDLALGVAMLRIWWTTRAGWVALVAEAVAIRLILHVLDSFTGHAFEVPYIHALNATFAWMIIVVASTGGNNAADTLLRGIRRVRALLSPALSSRRMKHGR